MQSPHLLSHFSRTARWMRRGGRDNDVVVSSRVRLARNFRRWEFPHRAAVSDLMQIRHKVFSALPHIIEEGSGLSKTLSHAGLLPYEDFTSWERQSLVDRHLTSREHIHEEAGRGLMATPDATLSLLVNEEDHLRLQSLLPGLQLDAAYSLVDKFDDALERYFDNRNAFAYSDTFGYVTACPTNAGTGMRASVMLHLPALEITGRIDRANKHAQTKGFTLRGTFGEGSKVWGNFHQLSNQMTLGMDESDLVLEVEALARELCEMERHARLACSKRHFETARDLVGRSYGVLRYARQLGCREATDCLSMLRLGLELGWLKGFSRQRCNELMVWIRPAYMQILHGRTLDSTERDTLRANLMRSHMLQVRLNPIIGKETSDPTDASLNEQVLEDTTHDTAS